MTLKNIVQNSTTRFVDVRSEMEFKTGHVKGALNIPLEQFQQRYKEIEGLGKNPVVFYCYSGNRSGQAVSYLHRLAVDNIYNGGSLKEIQRYLSRNN